MKEDHRCIEESAAGLGPRVLCVAFATIASRIPYRDSSSAACWTQDTNNPVSRRMGWISKQVRFTAARGKRSAMPSLARAWGPPRYAIRRSLITGDTLMLWYVNGPDCSWTGKEAGSFIGVGALVLGNVMPSCGSDDDKFKWGRFGL